MEAKEIFVLFLSPSVKYGRLTSMKAETAEYYENLAIEDALREKPKAKAEWEAFASSVGKEALLPKKYIKGQKTS